MDKLDTHLSYFIQRKIDEDVKWRGLEGTFSSIRIAS